MARQARRFALGQRLIHARNPNVAAHRDWFSGVKGARCRWVPFNGGCGKRQVRWLWRTLAAACARGDRVILSSHLPLSPRVSGGTTLPWDYGHICRVLRAHPNVVPLALAGHSHAGSTGFESRCGTLFYTVPSPIEASTSGGAFALLEVRPHRVDVRGVGDVWDVAVAVTPPQ
jgi:manganese-dependent ADP-ribose/CDP-alcohol diphosphatase